MSKPRAGSSAGGCASSSAGVSPAPSSAAGSLGVVVVVSPRIFAKVAATSGGGSVASRWACSYSRSRSTRRASLALLVRALLRVALVAALLRPGGRLADVLAHLLAEQRRSRDVLGELWILRPYRRSPGDDAQQVLGGVPFVQRPDDALPRIVANLLRSDLAQGRQDHRTRGLGLRVQ